MTATNPEIPAFASRIGYEFKNPELLQHAFAHRSWCAENEGAESNERLEFLGDAVLGLIVTTYLYNTYPDLPEGELAKIRASVVSSAILAEVAQSLDLGSAMLLGRGESQSGGREKPSILADAIEAVIGAIYLDGGWQAAEPFVMELLEELITQSALGPGGQDFKTRLQEWSAQEFEELPKYELSETGPDHSKVFSATVYLRGVAEGHGEGRSKKQAEQNAARVAWEKLAVKETVLQTKEN